MVRLLRHSQPKGTATDRPNRQALRLRAAFTRGAAVRPLSGPRTIAPLTSARASAPRHPGERPSRLTRQPSALDRAKQLRRRLAKFAPVTLDATAMRSLTERVTRHRTVICHSLKLFSIRHMNSENCVGRILARASRRNAKTLRG